MLLHKPMEETPGVVLMIYEYGQLAFMTAEESVNRAFDAGWKTVWCLRAACCSRCLLPSDHKESMDAFVNNRDGQVTHR